MIKLKSKSDNSVYFFALGGLEHVGQNMYVYKFHGKYLVVDCGMGFIDETVGAGDVKYSDTSWLEEHKKDVLGFVITHGHEDHIGALKYIWGKFKKPIYTTRFPAEIIKRTFKAMDINLKEGKDLIIYNHNGDNFKIGEFEIETFHVSHSIPEAQMIYIKTDAGNILHTGDWTFNDEIPIENKTDYLRLKEIGSDPNLLAVACDSTSPQRANKQITEIEVKETLSDIMKKAPGRVFVTGYSRSIARIKMFADAAKQSGRIPCIKERSNTMPVPYVGLQEFRELGIKFDYLKEEDTYLFSEIKDLPVNKQAIYLTGSQGEKFAMMTRLCKKQVKELQLQPTDTVVFSSIIIPGREKDVSFLYNSLAKLGIHTKTIFDTDNLHASGHAGRPEFEKFYEIIHPQTIIPMHGEYIAEVLNGKMAMEKGGAKHIMIVNNGDVIKLSKDKEPEVVETVPTGFIVSEGEVERNLNDDVYRNRKKISTSGAIFISLIVDKKGYLKDKPIVSSVGLFETDKTGIMKNIQIEISKAIDSMGKAERKSQDNLRKMAQVKVNKIIRGIFGSDKSPSYVVHFILR